jgi:tetratricopeptide (TPR) repeat protein
LLLGYIGNKQMARHRPQHGIALFAAAVIGFLGSSMSSAVAADNTPSLMSVLGTVAFPNSGAAAAQTPFLTGVKALHSFQFDVAADAFRAAQEADPDFALAYWGEAMSFNHPLWAQQDGDAARATLARYALTADARSAKTPAGRERGLMEAIDVLYGVGDKLIRDIAYSEAMQALYETYPEDDEIAIPYALSLLGTVRSGDTGFSRQMQAAAISLKVFEKNPKHPGAAHFIIHSLDDPEHAILALPAARVYADIAPDAPHALHMPSHIFVQLGMWDEVVASNILSYKASVDLAERKNLERGRSDFHALSWLQYGHLQLGHIEEAKRNLDMAMQTEKEHPTNMVHNGAMMMLARYILESGRWTELDPDQITERDNDHAGLQFVVGLSAVHTENTQAAKAALAKLTDVRQRFEAKPATAYRGKVIAVGEKELEAAMALAEGDDDTAEQFFIEATALEAALNAPSGPPLPMKPSFEMYGEFLLEQGRLEEAEVQFKKALARTPNRTKSVQGLERALSKPADTASLR